MNVMVAAITSVYFRGMLQSKLRFASSITQKTESLSPKYATQNKSLH